MASTVADLIEEVRRVLFTGAREERNKLSADVTAAATTIPVTYSTGAIALGAKLSIDLEDIYVWNVSGLNVTPVDRGQFGSAAAAHTSGAIVHVNPKFSNWEIFNAVNDEINALSAPTTGLFNVGTETLIYSPAVQGYSFANTIATDILEVRYAVPGPSEEWPISTDWEFSRNMSAGFTSGMALFVRDAFPNQTVVAKFKYPYTLLPATMTASTSRNIPDTVVDIIALGAAWRLTAPREVKRGFDESQGSTRRPGEVPPGLNINASRELARLRQLRINEEVSRLAQQYPNRKRRYPYTITNA